MKTPLDIPYVLQGRHQVANQDASVDLHSCPGPGFRRGAGPGMADGSILAMRMEGQNLLGDAGVSGENTTKYNSHPNQKPSRVPTRYCCCRESPGPHSPTGAVPERPRRSICLTATRTRRRYNSRLGRARAACDPCGRSSGLGSACLATRLWPRPPHSTIGLSRSLSLPHTHLPRSCAQANSKRRQQKSGNVIAFGVRRLDL